MVVSRMLKEYLDWPYLDQVFRLERRVWEHGKESVEVRQSAACSGPCEAADADRPSRVGIENGLHHRRDMIMQEDACQVRCGRAPQVLAVLNNLVLGLVLKRGEHNLAASQREFAYSFDRLLARRPLSLTFVRRLCICPEVSSTKVAVASAFVIAS